jgi:uncharacterized protein YggE
MHQLIENNKQIIIRIALILAVLLGLFLLAATFAKVKEYRYIGAGLPAGSTITVTGSGKVEKSPDTAKISFTVTENAKTVSAAQDTVSKKVSAATGAVVDAGVEEKYVTTDSYNSYPNYDYPQVTCLSIGCPKPGSPVLRDYSVSQTVRVSVKNLDIVPQVLEALGKAGVTAIDGPNFGFDDDKEVSREARDMAIEDAQAEAEKLAAALGVTLVRVVGFNENGGGMPGVMYAQAGMARDAKEAMPPVVPTGVQTVQSSVSVTYEIR